MKKVTLTLSIGIALVAAVAALTLTRSPPRVVRANGSSESAALADISGDIAVCQGNEVLPAQVSAVRLSMWAFFGWKIHVRAYSSSQVLTEGRRGPDWTSTSVTVPVTPLNHASRGVVLCFEIGPNSEPVLLLGKPTPAKDAAVIRSNSTSGGPREGKLTGKVGVEYLSAGSSTWWSRATSVVQHIGFGRAFSGTWIALLIAVLMAAVAVLAVRLTLRELP